MPYINILIDDEIYRQLKEQAKIRGLPMYKFIPQVLGESLPTTVNPMVEEVEKTLLDFGISREITEKPMKTPKNGAT